MTRADKERRLAIQLFIIAGTLYGAIVGVLALWTDRNLDYWFDKDMPYWAAYLLTFFFNGIALAGNLLFEIIRMGTEQ